MAAQAVGRLVPRAETLRTAWGPGLWHRVRWSSTLQNRDPTFNSYAPGKALKKPHLAMPYIPEADLPKMPIYHISKEWTVIYTKTGRPYYFNPETGECTWAHPRTGAVTPPSRPPHAVKYSINATLDKILSAIGYCIASIAILGLAGLAPGMGRLFGNLRVKQVEDPQAKPF